MDSITYQGDEFKPIPLAGWEGYYVSDKGEILSYRKPGPSHLLAQKPKKLRPKIRKDGYLAINGYVNKTCDTRLIHYLVMLAWVGPRPHKADVNHIDYNRGNNNLANLEYVTRQQNVDHSFNHIPRGEKHHSTRLKNEDVLQIIKLREAGQTYAQIGVQFGINRTAVSRIVRGHHWQSVTQIETDRPKRT